MPSVSKNNFRMLCAAVVIGILTLCMLGNFKCFFVVCGFFFFPKLFKTKNLSEIPSECQTVWIQIRPNIFWADLGPNCLQRLSADDNRLPKGWKSKRLTYSNFRIPG